MQSMLIYDYHSLWRFAQDICLVYLQDSPGNRRRFLICRCFLTILFEESV